MEKFWSLKNKMDISIIILTRNREKLLLGCISSIKNSRINACYETIVVDNGSSDGTRKLLENEKKRNKNFNCILNAKNIGVGAGRNTGLKKAKGDFIFFIDDDAHVKENAVSRLFD